MVTLISCFLFGADVNANVNADSNTLTGLAEQGVWGFLIMLIVTVLLMALFTLWLYVKRDSAHDKNFQALFVKFTEGISEMNSANRDLAQAVQEFKTVVESQFHVVKANIAEVASDVDTVCSGMEDVKVKVGTIQTAVDGHSAALNDHEVKINAINQTITAHDTRLQEVGNGLKTHGERLDGQDKKIIGQEGRIDQQDAKVEAAVAQVVTLGDKVEDVSAQIATLKQPAKGRVKKAAAKAVRAVKK